MRIKKERRHSYPTFDPDSIRSEVVTLPQAHMSLFNARRSGFQVVMSNIFFFRYPNDDDLLTGLLENPQKFYWYLFNNLITVVPTAGYTLQAETLYGVVTCTYSQWGDSLTQCYPQDKPMLLARGVTGLWGVYGELCTGEKFEEVRRARR